MRRAASPIYRGSRPPHFLPFFSQFCVRLLATGGGFAPSPLGILTGRKGVTLFVGRGTF